MATPTYSSETNPCAGSEARQVENAKRVKNTGYAYAEALKGPIKTTPKRAPGSRNTATK